MSKKCTQCGLVNWEHDAVCKRCGSSLNQATPPAYKWFVAYCIFMALLYLTTAVMGVVFMIAQPDPEMGPTESKIMGSVLIILGVMFFLPFVSAPFLPRRSWAWVVGLVLICLGLTSACCLPVCIPLLLFWLKPEMKSFYGRNLNPVSPPPPPPQWS